MLKTNNPTRPTGIDDLLDPGLVARLSALDITARKVLAGKLKGERRSKKRGESVEFADHRQYVVGDDLRHIDWNIFGRLDRLFLKLFLEEEDLSLQIVIDASASSDCGSPSKIVAMQRIASALGYLGLANLHRVNVTVMGGFGIENDQGVNEPQLMAVLRDLRGRRRLTEMVRFICQINPGGSASFTEVAQRIYAMRRGKGVMLILSDFLFKEGYDEGLRILAGSGYEVFCIQVLSPQELKPDIGGDVRMKDLEDGNTAEVTITASLLKQYEKTLTAYCTRLREFCNGRGMGLQTVPSSVPVDQLILDYLRQRGVVT